MDTKVSVIWRVVGKTFIRGRNSICRAHMNEKSLGWLEREYREMSDSTDSLEGRPTTGEAGSNLIEGMNGPPVSTYGPERVGAP